MSDRKKTTLTPAPPCAPVTNESTRKAGFSVNFPERQWRLICDAVRRGCDPKNGQAHAWTRSHWIEGRFSWQSDLLLSAEQYARSKYKRKSRSELNRRLRGIEAALATARHKIEKLHEPSRPFDWFLDLATRGELDAETQDYFYGKWDAAEIVDLEKHGGLNFGTASLKATDKVIWLLGEWEKSAARLAAETQATKEYPHVDLWGAERQHPRVELYTCIFLVWTMAGGSLKFSRREEIPHGPLVEFVQVITHHVMGNEAPTLHTIGELIEKERAQRSLGDSSALC